MHFIVHKIRVVFPRPFRFRENALPVATANSDSRVIVLLRPTSVDDQIVPTDFELVVTVVAGVVFGKPVGADLLVRLRDDHRLVFLGPLDVDVDELAVELVRVFSSRRRQLSAPEFCENLAQRRTTDACAKLDLKTTKPIKLCLFIELAIETTICPSF